MDLKKKWESLSSGGVKPSSDFAAIKRIRILNQFSVVGIYIALSYTVFLLILSEHLLAALDAAIVIAGFIVMVLVRKFHYKLAGVFMFLSIPFILMFINKVYGRAGAEYYFFSMFILAYYVFPQKKYLLPILFYLLVLFALALNFSVHATPGAMALMLAPWFYYVNLVCAFVIAGIFLQLFANEHIKYQKQVEDKSEQLKVAMEKAMETGEKNKILFNELAHRTKNNLQIISSLINIQSGKIGDETAREALRESNNRIQSIALIHQQLYNNDEKLDVEVKLYVEELLSYLIKSLTPVEETIVIEKQIDEFSVKTDDMMSIGLIMNELLTNAFKHGEYINGRMQVNVSVLKTKEPSVEITVSNSGTGVERILLLSDESSFGTKLIHMLVTQQMGSLELLKNGENGVKVVLSINL